MLDAVNSGVLSVPFGRPDLFVGVRGRSGEPPTFVLVEGLKSAQRVEAYQIVERDYPMIAYGTFLIGNEIKTYRAD